LSANLISEVTDTHTRAFCSHDRARLPAAFPEWER